MNRIKEGITEYKVTMQDYQGNTALHVTQGWTADYVNQYNDTEDLLELLEELEQKTLQEQYQRFIQCSAYTHWDYMLISFRQRLILNAKRYKVTKQQLQQDLINEYYSNCFPDGIYHEAWDIEDPELNEEEAIPYNIYDVEENELPF